MAKHIVDLSKQKFSSNVIEKCLDLNIDNFLDKVIQTFCNSEQLPLLIIHEFANYVVQRSIKAGTNE